MTPPGVELTIMPAGLPEDLVGVDLPKPVPIRWHVPATLKRCGMAMRLVMAGQRKATAIEKSTRDDSPRTHLARTAYAARLPELNSKAADAAIAAKVEPWPDPRGETGSMRESTWREEGRTENRHEKARTTAGFFNKECLITKYSDFLAGRRDSNQQGETLENRESAKPVTGITRNFTLIRHDYLFLANPYHGSTSSHAELSHAFVNLEVVLRRPANPFDQAEPHRTPPPQFWFVG